MRPLVSIIIPALNGERFFGEDSPMLRATLTVLERHIRLNSGLSKRSVNRARGQVYTLCLRNRLDCRRYVDALKMLARLALHDPSPRPVSAPLKYLDPLPDRLTVLCKAVGSPPKMLRRATFYEVDPLEIGPLPAEI
jgi:hypothetical protein